MWTPNDYHHYIRFSTKRHILVEGRDDKRLLKALLNELIGEPAMRTVEIDTAEQLIGFDEIAENRKKVEAVNDRIANKPYGNKIVCFVDREFRGFDLDRMHDDVGEHRVSGRLVWTRGHSVEFFF